MNIETNNRAQNQLKSDHILRKSDHILLTKNAQINEESRDKRFYYEPAISGNSPCIAQNTQINFLNKKLKFPLWISSMTGGTGAASIINKNIATACKEFGLGMGLGSCRQILKDQTRFEEFNMRPICGDETPLYANIGIGQLETMINERELYLLDKLINKLDVDGIIIHINPLQEYLQPEGDLYSVNPIEAISRIFNHFGDDKINIIVKEVGQGMGPTSLEALFNLPIKGLELAAFGGTNFSKIEQLRSTSIVSEKIKSPFINIGHTPLEMISFINTLKSQGKVIPDIIISGGVKSALDAFYYNQLCQANSVYGIASRVLEFSMGDYEQLREFLQLEIEAYKLCSNLLKVKDQDGVMI